ncbi:hypothetical protein LVD15_21845 [Fulvivirga maritima]|uniref:hypothetical protein n=1 Tax=Fulvivirga maritima TaxID=2904247 RepID=UPI001F390823|nr:hypothetical protein [Fulvivirga maritima]UII25916.1 hypothetical protein LVD15_21845 [Fulvivirga maritima]
MRKINLILATLFTVMVFGTAQAQDDEYLTDENLRRYAIMEEVIDDMKSEISVVLNDMIKNQEGIDGKRYSELKSGSGEAASDFENKFMDQINNMVEERKEAIGDVVKILATKMLPDGGKAYNAIKSKLASDEELKTKYAAIKAEVTGETAE